MSSEIRQRIVREATPEEKERHRALRDEIESRASGAQAMGSSGCSAAPIGTGSQSGRCLAAPRHPSSKRSIITRLNILCRARRRGP